MNRKLSLLLIFGGVSPEHEVSVVTGFQVLNHIDRGKYDVSVVYIVKDGRWLYSPKLSEYEKAKEALKKPHKLKEVYLWLNGEKVALRAVKRPIFGHKIEKTIDIVLPAMHGGAGENGSLQGLFETLGLAYVGSSPKASALNMDKVIEKDIFRSHNLPVVPHLSFSKKEWQEKNQDIIKQINSQLGSEVVIKPANLGSSIGITKIKSEKDLAKAVDLALTYTDKVLIEKTVVNLQEINISVVGDKDSQKVSVAEEPTSKEEILSFEEKYLKGGKKMKGMASMGRKVPAPISDKQRQEIEELAKKAFVVTDCSGLVRIDFMFDRDSNEIYINEINTIPGSFSYYLWEATGMTFAKLLDELVNLGIKRQENKKTHTTHHDTELLQKFLEK